MLALLKYRLKELRNKIRYLFMKPGFFVQFDYPLITGAVEISQNPEGLYTLKIKLDPDNKVTTKVQKCLLPVPYESSCFQLYYPDYYEKGIDKKPLQERYLYFKKKMNEVRKC